MKKIPLILCGFLLCVRTSSGGGIPYPAALNGAAVLESRITDINREALMLGNGDLNGLLWERNGTLCLRVAKNDVWDARIDTSQDVPMMQVDVANRKWNGGGYPPSWKQAYPHPRCAAVVRIGATVAEAGAGQRVRAEGSAPRISSARLDLRHAVAELDEAGAVRTVVRVLADRNVFLIETAKEVSLEEIKAKELPAAEQGESNGVKWLHMKMPGDMDYAGMEYAMAVAANGKQKAVSLVTSFDTKENVRSEAIRLARDTVAEEPSRLIARHDEEWLRYWSASGVANHEARSDEPCVFRRCWLCCLDWWGDAGAAYVRCSHTSIPNTPDATFEDCTLVSPDNALEVGYPNFPGHTRVKFTKCRLLVLNFSQPGGTPSGGIIHTPLDGKQLHVDLEDCQMMGYKVFSTEGKSPIGYTLTGKVQAYVQFQQPLPDGIERLAQWPVESFARLAPPETHAKKGRP